MAAPSFRSAGSVVGGTTTATFDASGEYPSGYALGDILVLLAETANQPGPISAGGVADPNNLCGWEPIPGFTPGGTGTAGGTAATRIAGAWWRRVKGSTALATVRLLNDGGNHVNGRILAFSGCETEEDPFDPAGVAQAVAAAATAVSFPAYTTTIDEATVVDACAAPIDSSSGQFSAWSGAGLTSYAERSDLFNTSGNGGGIGVGSGSKSPAGSAGARSATLASSVVQDKLTFALIPPQTRDYTGFPVVESRFGGGTNSNKTNHAVALPATINPDDLVVIWFTADGGASITWDQVTAGAWTQLYDAAVANVVRQACYYKFCDGSEAGDTLTVVTGSGEQCSWRGVRVSKAQGIQANTPSTMTSSDGFANYPNPGPLTPAWGNKKTLWLSAIGTDDETNTVINPPNNYNEFTSVGGSAGSGTITSVAEYRKETATESPSAWITGQGEDNVAALIAIEPAPQGTTTPQAVQATTTPVPTIGRALIKGKALTVTSTPVPTITRGAVGKRVMAQTSAAATIRRGMARALSVTTSPASFIREQTSKFLRITTTAVPTIARGRLASLLATTSPAALIARILQAVEFLSVPTSPAATILKSPTRRLSVTASPAASMFRGMARAVFVTTTPPPRIIRDMAKRVDATTTPVPIITDIVARVRAVFITTTPAPLLDATKGASRSIQAATTPVPTITRTKSILLAVSAATSPAVSMIRGLSRALHITTAPAPTLTRGRPAEVQAATAPAASVTTAKTIRERLDASTSPAARIVRQMAAQLDASTSPAARIVRRMAEALSVTSAPAPSLDKGTPLRLDATTTPRPSIRRAITARIAAEAGTVAWIIRGTYQTLAAATSPAATIARGMAKRVAAATSPAATIGRAKTILRPLTATTAPAASIARLAGKSVQAVTAPVASMLRGITRFLFVETPARASLIARRVADYLSVNPAVWTIEEENRVLMIDAEDRVWEIEGP